MNVFQATVTYRQKEWKEKEKNPQEVQLQED